MKILFISSRIAVIIILAASISLSGRNAGHVQIFRPDESSYVIHALPEQEVKHLAGTYGFETEYQEDTIEDAFKVAAKALGNDANYLGAVLTLKNREKNYSSKQERWYYLQAALTYNSFISNNIETDTLLSHVYRKPNSCNLDVFLSDSAVYEYIRRECLGQKMVMINERHWNPKHRYFGSMLLKYLYDIGFRYIALEALHEE